MTIPHKVSETVTLCEVVVIDLICILDYNSACYIAGSKALNNLHLRTKEEREDE